MDLLPEALHLLVQREESLGHQLDLRLHVLRHDVEVPARFGGPGFDKNLHALTLTCNERLQARAMVFKGSVNVLANSCLDGINMPSRLRGAGLDLPAQLPANLSGAGLDFLAKVLANLGAAGLDLLAQLPANFGGAGLNFLAQFLANFIQGRGARVLVHGS